MRHHQSKNPNSRYIYITEASITESEYPFFLHESLPTLNKVEAYNGFAKYFFFGGEGVIPPP
ncbi:hypothetical protein J7431_22005, partial [Xanthomonas phaseoli pv. dieffenbachiae]|nr:hypothetical protein [Xanthomonas phaseoli pv. dieffenbachiae]